MNISGVKFEERCFYISRDIPMIDALCKVHHSTHHLRLNRAFLKPFMVEDFSSILERL